MSTVTIHNNMNYTNTINKNDISCSLYDPSLKSCNALSYLMLHLFPEDYFDTNDIFIEFGLFYLICYYGKTVKLSTAVSLIKEIYQTEVQIGWHKHHLDYFINNPKCKIWQQDISSVADLLDQLLETKKEWDDQLINIVTYDDE